MSRRHLAVACIAVLWFAQSGWALVPGVPAPRVDIDLPSAGASPEERLRLAMLSVHAFVEKHGAALGPLLRNVETPSMTTVAKAIVDSKVPFARLARLFAVVRLVAHARRDPATTPAIDVLLGKSGRQKLYKWLDQHPSPRGCDTDPEKHVADGVKAVIIGQEQWLKAADACTDFVAYAHVDSPADTNDVSISTFADAGRRLDDAAPKLDPRSWADCSSLWAETYVIETDQNGMPVYQNGKPKKKTLTQNPGETFTGEVLYEDVKCEGKCSIQMLLNVNTVKFSSLYVVQFYRRDQLGGTPKLIGDYGHIKAEKNGSRVLVRSEKTLGFMTTADEAVIYAILSQIDMAAHLQRLVCCQ
jgi:hypothetical protein